MLREEVISEIKIRLNQMDADTLVGIHNIYCDEMAWGDSEIYYADMIDEILEGSSPSEILNMAFFGSFNSSAKYFKFDGYANLQSIHSSEVKDYVDLDEIAEYCVDADEDFNDIRIREIINALESNQE